MQITMKRTVQLRGVTYEAGSTYVVNASTYRALIEAGALKEEEQQRDPVEKEAAVESAELPKLQTKAQARKPVRRTRKTQK